MEIVWSKSALTRIEEISNFIVSDSPKKASQFIQSLIKSTEKLKKFPFSGQVTPENIAFRQSVFKGYRLIYRISAKQIQIITVISPGLSSTDIG